MTDTATNTPGLNDARELVAQACRVLAHRGLVDGHLGHVSLRWQEGMLMRYRGPAERGLRFTAAEDIKLIALDGSPLEDIGSHRRPHEWPIHGELMRRRPAVQAVVHAHPPAVLISALAELELLPVFGAFNIPAAQIAVAGVPVYPRAVLIRTTELAGELDDAMGEQPLCMMRGHGITVTGESVADALVRAVNLDTLARVSIELAQIGAQPDPVPESDLAEIIQVDGSGSEEVIWRTLTEAARADGY